MAGAFTWSEQTQSRLCTEQCMGVLMIIDELYDVPDALTRIIEQWQLAKVLQH